MDVDAVEVLILALVCYRVTRLLTLDTVFMRPRNTLVVFFASRGRIGIMLGKLAICPLCMSVWVAAALTTLVWALYGMSAPLAVFGAVAGLSCWMATLER